MSNEFVARNGIIALSNSVVSGSLTVTNGITGNITSASYALTASYAMNAAAGGGGASNLIFTGSITASVNTGAQTFRLISGSSTFLYVSSSGNVGIGVTNPLLKLDVAGNGTSRVLIGDAFGSAGYAGISLNSTASSTSYNILSSPSDQNLYINRPTGKNIHFREANVDHMVISASGNIGIGTTTPTTKLHVSSSSAAVYLRGSGSAIFAIDGNAGRLFSVDDSLSGSLYSVNTVAGLPVMEIFSDNTVRIGQYGQKGLFVSQSFIGIGTETPTAKVHITGSGPSVFEIDTAVNNTFYVSSSGQIGIGTGTPSFTLDMSGSSARFTTNMQITGSLSVSGSFTRYVNFNRQTGNYTLTITDDGKFIEMNSASANIVTVPSSSVVNFPSGSQITIVQYGAGQTQISGSTTGVTIRSANNWLKINARYGAATLTKIGGNEWYLQGNLNA